MLVCTLAGCEAGRAFAFPFAGVVGDGAMVEVEEVLVGAIGITLKVWKEVGVGNRSFPGSAAVLPLLLVRAEGYLMPSLESTSSRGISELSSGDSDAAESESAIVALTGFGTSKGDDWLQIKVRLCHVVCEDTGRQLFDCEINSSSSWCR